MHTHKRAYPALICVSNHTRTHSTDHAHTHTVTHALNSEHTPQISLTPRRAGHVFGISCRWPAQGRAVRSQNATTPNVYTTYTNINICTTRRWMARLGAPQTPHGMLQYGKRAHNIYTGPHKNRTSPRPRRRRCRRVARLESESRRVRVSPSHRGGN